jgi:hypothetical protein
MKLRFWIILAALAATALPGTLWATNTVLSGIFDGSAGTHRPCREPAGATALGYRA